MDILELLKDGSIAGVTFFFLGAIYKTITFLYKKNITIKKGNINIGEESNDSEVSIPIEEYISLRYLKETVKATEKLKYSIDSKISTYIHVEQRGPKFALQDKGIDEDNAINHNDYQYFQQIVKNESRNVKKLVLDLFEENDIVSSLEEIGETEYKKNKIDDIMMYCKEFRENEYEGFYYKDGKMIQREATRKQIEDVIENNRTYIEQPLMSILSKMVYLSKQIKKTMDELKSEIKVKKSIDK